MDIEFLFASLCTSLRVKDDSKINQDISEVASHCDLEVFRSKEYNINPEEPKESQVSFSEGVLEEPENNERNFLIIDTLEQSDETLIHIHSYIDSDFYNEIIELYPLLLDERDEIWLSVVGMDFHLSEGLGDMGAVKLESEDIDLTGVRYEDDETLTSIYQSEEDTLARRSTVIREWVNMGKFEEVVSSLPSQGIEELRKLEK